MGASAAFGAFIEVSRFRLSFTVETIPLSNRPICFVRHLFQRQQLRHNYLYPVRGPWREAISLRFPNSRLYKLCSTGRSSDRLIHGRAGERYDQRHSYKTEQWDSRARNETADHDSIHSHHDFGGFHCWVRSPALVGLESESNCTHVLESEILKPWQAIVIVGFTCSGIQIAALPAIAATYAIDSYKSAAGAIFISITINKNVWSYGMSKFITSWVEKQGYVPPFMTNMCLTVLWCSCGVIFWVWGKQFRRWTAKSSVHQI